LTQLVDAFSKSPSICLMRYSDSKGFRLLRTQKGVFPGLG